MKIWIIKHQGKSWWGNLTHDKEIELSDGSIIYAQFCFYRKKDAIKIMKTYHNEYLEVVSAEIEKSNKDNRKNS